MKHKDQYESDDNFAHNNSATEGETTPLSLSESVHTFSESAVMTSSQQDMAERLLRKFNEKSRLGSYKTAFVGIAHRCGSLPAVGLYEISRCIHEMVKVCGMEWDEAEDAFWHNFSIFGDHAEAFLHGDEVEDEFIEDHEQIIEFKNAFVGLVDHGGNLGSSLGYNKSICVDIIMQRNENTIVEAEARLHEIMATKENKDAPVFIEFVPGLEPKPS